MVFKKGVMKYSTTHHANYPLAIMNASTQFGVPVVMVTNIIMIMMIFCIIYAVDESDSF